MTLQMASRRRDAGFEREIVGPEGVSRVPEVAGEQGDRVSRRQGIGRKRGVGDDTRERQLRERTGRPPPPRGRREPGQRLLVLLVGGPEEGDQNVGVEQRRRSVSHPGAGRQTGRR